MSINIDESLRAIWFCEIPNGDWMCGLSSRPDGGFKLNYRFRYYKGPEVWDSKDDKSWYTGEGPDYAQGIQVVRQMITYMKMGGGGESWEYLRGDKSLRQFTEELLKAPFAHSKTVSREEYEEMRRDGRVP